MKIKGASHRDRGVIAEHDFAFLTPVEKVRRGIEADDRLDTAGFTINRIGSLGIAVVAGAALHQRKMTAGRGARDSQTAAVDAIVFGVFADEANGAVHVF